MLFTLNQVAELNSLFAKDIFFWHVETDKFRYTLDIRAVSCDEMYVDLESLCKDMQIGDVMGIITVIRSEILTKTGCNASVGVGKLKLLSFFQEFPMINIILFILSALLVYFHLYKSIIIKINVRLQVVFCMVYMNVFRKYNVISSYGNSTCKTQWPISD